MPSIAKVQEGHEEYRQAVNLEVLGNGVHIVLKAEDGAHKGSTLATRASAW